MQASRSALLWVRHVQGPLISFFLRASLHIQNCMLPFWSFSTQFCVSRILILLSAPTTSVLGSPFSPARRGFREGFFFLPFFFPRSLNHVWYVCGQVRKEHSQGQIQKLGLRRGRGVPRQYLDSRPMTKLPALAYLPYLSVMHVILCGYLHARSKPLIC